MAYNNKYKITVATKSDITSYLYLLEDGYEGELIEYPGVSLQLQYIPRSDNLYEPIIASQLNVEIDVTDGIENMPNFTTLNDRKYLVKLYSSDELEWQGWAISDSVVFSFSTGRKYLSFNCIDGIGMLEHIGYVFPSEETLVDRNTCLNFILNSLNYIQFPTGLNVISGISFYSENMDNRDDNISAEPLSQSYINNATFVDNNQNSDSALTILTKIVNSFGCKLLQAEGKWQILSFTEFAQDSYYFTEYDSSGTVVTSGTKSLTGLIEGYTGNTSGLFFVDNGQVKLIRKGYNKISFSKTIEVPNNYITNWDLKKYTTTGINQNTAFSWTQTFNPSLSQIYVKNYTTQKYNSFIMSSNETYISVKPNGLPKIKVNETIDLSFNVAGIGVPASGPDGLFLLKITLVSGSYTYYIDENNKWRNTGNNYYYYPFKEDDSIVNFTLNLPPSPASGVLSFEFILSGNTATYWKRTVGAVEVQNFQLKLKSSFKSLLTEAFINDSKEYVLNIDLALGFNDKVDGEFSYRGFLSDSSGVNLKSWYRYEYPSDIYRSLSELVIKQYSNCLNKNVINIDGSIMGMETEDGRLSAAMRIMATDTDPIQINVENKKYIIANSTIDLPNNVIQGTFLDINNENIDSTISTTYDTNTLTGTIAGVGHYRSTAYFTREAAYAAPLTTYLVYNGFDGVPSVGQVYYQNEELTLPFNGANLWWKIMTDDVNFHAFKISSVGVIIEIYG